MRNIKSRLLFGCTVFAIAQLAAAAPVSCVSGIHDLSNKVEGAVNCQRLAVVPGQNSANDHQGLMNTHAFFGVTTWTREGKYDDIGSANNSGNDDSNLFNFTGNDQAGAYSYVGPANLAMDIMLVFKSGKETNLVAYLLQSPFGVGMDYSSPFISGLFDVKNTKSISHISVYTSPRDMTVDVPEPGSLALLAIATVGFLARRRRR